MSTASRATANAATHVFATVITLIAVTIISVGIWRGARGQIDHAQAERVVQESVR
jgi:hypothetical protein